MTAYNPPLYAFPNINFNPAIYEQGATYTLSSSNLTTNNTWTGTNTFSNVAGIATNLIDAITSTTLSIGTSMANAISIGKSAITTTINGFLVINNDVETYAGVTITSTTGGQPLISTTGGTLSLADSGITTNVIGPLKVGAGSNTITTDTSFGLNRLFLNTSAGTSGQVLTSGGSGGSLSWATGSGGVSLSGNNTWTGTNNFSNALGVITSWLDTLTAGVLSIGTSVASSITLGSASIATNVKGALTVGAGSNTIQLNANSGLNQLLLTGSAGTSGQVLTSGGSSGSLSWATGSGGVSLSGTNTWTGMNTFSGGLTMGGSNNITLGNGTVAPTLGQIGYVGYGNAGGYFSQNFKTGSIDYVYGAVLLPTGTYMFSVYISINTTFTYLRTVIQTGTSAPANGTLGSVFSPGYTFPSNGGNGIVCIPNGFTVVSGAPEYTSFGVGTITSTLPYIALTVNLGGAGATIAGIYSLQYMRIA